MVLVVFRWRPEALRGVLQLSACGKRWWYRSKRRYFTVTSLPVKPETNSVTNQSQPWSQRSHTLHLSGFRQHPDKLLKLPIQWHIEEGRAAVSLLFLLHLCPCYLAPPQTIRGWILQRMTAAGSQQSNLRILHTNAESVNRGLNFWACRVLVSFVVWVVLTNQVWADFGPCNQLVSSKTTKRRRNIAETQPLCPRRTRI